MTQSNTDFLIPSILATHLGQEGISITRFPTGLCHYVYDVVLADGQQVVVRVTSADRKRYLQGALFWHPRLKQLGVPVPDLIAFDLEADLPYMIIERLPGTDLGNVYAEMTVRQKKDLSARLADIQDKVAGFTRADGFGYSIGYEDAEEDLSKDWMSVLYSELRTAENRIGNNGIFDTSCVHAVREMIDKKSEYFTRVEPVAFLDDITTKNVIIDNGSLSGIVDTDEICFGDSLKTVALTRMSLLLSGYDTDYIDFWTSHRQLTGDQKKALEIYTALYCVGFMGETGMQFNKDAPVPVDKVRINRLNDLFVMLTS